MRILRDERGSAPAEFVMVAGLLTVLTLAIVQLALALYVRNIVQDAAVEGAFHAALADTSTEDGRLRVIEQAGGLPADILNDVSVVEDAGRVSVTVHARLPLLGFLGIDRGMEVTAYAPSETFDR